MQLPWRTSPRTGLSSGSSVVVTAVTGLLLAFVAASAVLCAVSTGSAAVGYEAARQCPQNLLPTVTGLQATGAQTTKVAADVARVATELHLPKPVFAAYSRVFRPDLGTPQMTWLRMAYRDDATANLHAIQQTHQPTGMWLPQSAAQADGIGLGPAGSWPAVTGIYTDLTDPLPPFWCTESTWAVYNPELRDGASAAPAFLPKLSDLTAVHGLFDLTVHFTTPIPATMAEADQIATLSTQLAAKLNDAFAADNLSPVAVVQQPFAKALANAQQARADVVAFVLPLTAVSLLVGLVGVGAIAAQWCQRRQAQLRLLWSRGSAPISLGGKALLELGGPLLVGAALGLTTARLTLPWYAPVADLDPGTTATAIALVLATIVAAMLVLTATATLRTHRMFQTHRRTKIPTLVRAVPFELPIAVAAVFSWVQLSAGNHTDAFALAFPVLVVVVIAGLAARLGRLLLTWSHRLKVWSVPSVQLAVRRLAAAATAATGVLLVGVLAVGTLAVGHSIDQAAQNALASKTGNFVGAKTSIHIATTYGQRTTSLPASIDGQATIVGLDDGIDTILVVDPQTFARGAWLDDNTRDQTLNLLDKLGSNGAIAIGSVTAGPITEPGFTQLHTIGQLPTFPGMPKNLGYVTSRAAVTGPSEINSWYVWSPMAATTLLNALATAGIDHISPTGVLTVDQALDALPFYTVEWTFGYIASVGALLAVIAAASLLLAVGARRKQTALSGALAVRMGLRARTLILSHLVEFGAVAGSVVLAGLATGLAAAATTVIHLDPAPWLRPAEALPDSVAFVVISLVTGCAVVAVAGWIAVAGVRTARVGELIRG